jgi:hypothetical protein
MTASVQAVEDGGGGIRTHGALSDATVFKTAPFDRSGTPPETECRGTTRRIRPWRKAA